MEKNEVIIESTQKTEEQLEKERKELGLDKEQYPRWINRCTICNVDMGDDNSRQLCRKWYCENEADMILLGKL